jgi:hypothetical protein
MEAENLNEPKNPALQQGAVIGRESVICRARFSGAINKSEFYKILEHIDGMKARGWYFVHHERVDSDNSVSFQYDLALRGQE